tara:strand:- start:1912 stop:2142 length:231 start_codon:yes stop_codon:yes gene_type:complete
MLYYIHHNSSNADILVGPFKDLNKLDEFAQKLTTYINTDLYGIYTNKMPKYIELVNSHLTHVVLPEEHSIESARLD